jgi:lysozyme family protein
MTKMPSTENDIIEDIIDREGGYVNHPSDKGGPTNYGITKFVLAAWRGKRPEDLTERDMMLLSPGEASDIYREMYIHRPGLGRIPDDKLRSFLVDTGVNHGPKRAIKMLQRALKIPDDGVIGPKTMLALFSAEPTKLFADVVAERAVAYGKILTADPSQSVFAHGWMNRLAGFIRQTAR